MTPPEARAQALAESRFFAHLALFAVVTPLIVGLIVGLAEPPAWLPWAAASWAFVVALHGVAAFGRVLGSAWVERRARALQTHVDQEWPGRVEGRLARIEEGPRPIVPDSRPGASRWGAGEIDGDPFVADRAPVETPRLGGRRPRSAARDETDEPPRPIAPGVWGGKDAG